MAAGQAGRLQHSANTRSIIISAGCQATVRPAVVMGTNDILLIWIFAALDRGNDVPPIRIIVHQMGV